VASGWVFLWAFFRFIAPPLSRLDDGFVRLFTAGVIEPYSFWWWCRSTVVWIVVAFPFFASGWVVAKIASAAPIPVALAFAMSVSVTIAVVLLLDGPFNTDLRMWLTVPLFLMVAPSTLILIGGLFGTRRART
jgi:hypothetical protein